MIKQNILFSFIILILILPGCTLDEIGNSNQETVTEDDLQAAAQILGEALSNDNSGVVLSVKDALAIISQNGFSKKNKYKTPQNPYNPIQVDSGGNNDSYNPDTGIHTFILGRQVSNALFSKVENDTLTYIYRDQDNNFIQYPREQRESIASINYTGIHEGQLSSLDRESIFIRKDTLLITGFRNNMDFLRIEGTHNGQGSTQIYQYQDKPIERSYELQINFLNVDVEQDVLDGDSNVDKAVTGTLSWQLLLKATDNKSSVRLAGTIRLNGDGTGLMKFGDNPRVYIFNLTNGKVKNLNNEFEGAVVSVSISTESASVSGGFSVYLNDQTKFESEAYPSLKIVQDSLNAQVPVYTEGKGAVKNGQFIVSEITFKRPRMSTPNQEEPIYFDNIITSVDVAAQTFTLAEKAAVQINGDVTTIDENGDYNSLQEVADALQQGKHITAKGKSTLSSSFQDRITARVVKFENN